MPVARPTRGSYELEQRTGRLDRIGAIAGLENTPIELYEPYFAGTHEATVFRVVDDCARWWFGIVMGRASGPDEYVTDVEEARVRCTARSGRHCPSETRTWAAPTEMIAPSAWRPPD